MKKLFASIFCIALFAFTSFAFPFFNAIPALEGLIVFFNQAITSQSTSDQAGLVSSTLVINEVDYDQIGTDGAEYLELKNVSADPINLDNYSVQLVNGNGGLAVVYDTIDLPNVNLAAGDYYVICANTATVVNCDLDDAPDTDFIQNGAPDAIGLRLSGTLIDAVSYEGNTGAPYTENTGTPTATASDSNTVGFIGLSRFADGTDTDNNSVDLTIRCISPGTANLSTTSGCTAPTTSSSPSGVGTATPNSLFPGDAVTLSVTVTPGTLPTSTGISVAADLTTIGGTATQTFFDDGAHGDGGAADNVFAFQTTVSAGTTAGAKSLPVTITDAQVRTGSTNISLTVNSVSTGPSGVGTANPTSVDPGESSLLTVSVTPGTNPSSTGITVTGNLSLIGGSSTQSFFDNGTNGDVSSGDNVFSFLAAVDAATAPGAKSLPTTVADTEGRSSGAPISLTVTAPAAGGQPLPFSQNWTDTNLITTDDTWASVPGIIGYRGDNLTGGTGVDPQTITADGSATPIDVNANNTTPNTFTSGGVTEFQISDPVVALQGSGTARAPHIVISVNTVGATNITMRYNLRDVDGSPDNSAQPVALQYRIGDTGTFTNVPAAFVADASSGPDLATKVTAVGVLLPALIENQSLVQLRIITADAVGSDEWTGIDDILIESNGTLPLSATGSANPTLVDAGSNVTLSVSVGPATNPLSTGIVVTGNLTTIGGSATQSFLDDGLNGDVSAGDNVFTYVASVPANQPGGTQSLSISVSDAQVRNAATSIGLTVRAATDPQVHLTLGNPSGAVTDVAQENNYLMLKNQYVLSYNRSRSTANWVAWHLDSSWIGSAPRQDDFRPDTTLPAGWYQVTETDFSGTGFDRGHHTPSGDRTASIPDNSATFLMTNMMPQAPDNNQGPWEALESFSRTLAGQGNEMYIYMGGVGMGGSGFNGGVTNTVANGNVVVPSYTWKVIFILPSGENDLSRITASTRAIAVIVPNRQGLRFDPWQKYLATVDQIEALTGYDFLSGVSAEIQESVESQLDTASNTSPQTIGTGTFTDLAIDGPNTTLTGDVVVNGVLTLGGSTLRTSTNKITLGPNAVVNRISGLVDGNFEKQFTSLGSFEFPVGTVTQYSPMTLNVTNLGVSPSSLTVRAISGVQPQFPVPDRALKRYWSITESGDITGDMTFKYLDVDFPAVVGEEGWFSIFKYDGQFTRVPTSINTAQNTATTTGVSSFSDWMIVSPLAPTAASVTVGGRVKNQFGRAISSAIVTLVDGNGEPRSVRTNTFGYFSLQNVRAGESYVLMVNHRSYRFDALALNISDNVSDLQIVARP